MSANWSDLPDDVLVLILEKLPVPDSIRFGAVCVSWRPISRKKLQLPHSKPLQSPPWLMLPGDNNQTAHFFNLSENKVHRIPLPTPPIIRRSVCYGSSHGWLITVDDASQMHLLNPVTGAHIQLPPIDTLPFVDAVRDDQGRVTEFTVVNDLFGMGETPDRFTNLKRMRTFFFQKAVLSSAPSGGDFTVMLIHEPGWRLAFTRAGDKTWYALRTDDAFEDIIQHKGQFYVVANSGPVYVLEPRSEGHSFVPRLVIGTQDISADCRYMSKYLAESVTGQLMMIFRGRGGCFDHTRKFKVFILFDEDTSGIGTKWSHVENDMGDDVIFLGSNHSMSVSASKFPELRRNCIYFTDDYFGIINLLKRIKRDVGLYDMGEKAIKPIDSLPSHFKWPPPVWLTPNIL